MSELDDARETATAPRFDAPRPDAAEPAPPGGRAAARRAAKGGGRRRRAPKQGLRRWAKPLAVTTGVAVVVTAGAGYLYYRHLNGNIQAGTRNLGDEQGNKTAPDAKGRTPLNILLLGTDSRASKENVDLGGSADEAGRPGLADVQMLLHVSADRSNASLVSIPRDTMVTVPTCKDGTKTYPATPHTAINEALARSGPGCVLATWTSLTGLYIDHYMMVDFSGVVRIADAIGGVPVCVTMNMYDRYQPGVGGTGLKVPKGTHNVMGEDALKWLRTRDAWGSDIGRTKAQHLYLSSMIRQLRGSGRLDSPTELMKLADAATKSLAVDTAIADLMKLYNLAEDIRTVPTERISTLTVPTLADPANPKAKLVLKDADTKQIWSMLLADRPLDGKPAEQPTATASGAPPAASPTATPSPVAPPVSVNKGAVGLTVQNASGAGRRATEVAGALVEAGYGRAAAASGGGTRETTQLLYPAGQRAQAEAVAADLKLPASALTEAGSGKTLTLVIGKDWTSGTAFPAATPTPVPTALPTSVDAKTSDDDKDCMEVNPQGGIYTY